MKDFFKNCLSSTLILSLVYIPMTPGVAHAETLGARTSRVCGTALGNMDQYQKLQPQFLGECQQADLARQSHDWEIAKAILYTAGAATCTGLEIAVVVEKGVRTAGYTEIGTGDALLASIYTIPLGVADIVAGEVSVAQANAAIQGMQNACRITDSVTSAAGFAVDITGRFVIGAAAKNYQQATDSQLALGTYLSAFSLLISPAVINFLGLAGGTGVVGTVTKKINSIDPCIKGAVILGAEAGVSYAMEDASKKTAEKLLDAAEPLGKTIQTTVTGLAPGQISLTQQTAQPINPTGAPAGGAIATPTPSTSCSNGAGGAAYLNCMATQNPELSALTNSGFTNMLGSALHGQNLGDFMKNFKGDAGDIPNYVASGLGMNPAFVAGVVKGGEKLAKDSGFDTYIPSGYTKSGGGAGAAGGGDLDFSKMMGGLMGKLDPGGKDGTKDPSELVFRQLDLLPPDKIEGNKDISLFVRVAFRYRKASSYVDPQNWSEVNQKK